MKEYKLLFLNTRIRFSKQTDLNDAAKIINEQVEQGWEFVQISPCAGSVTNAMTGVFCREKPTEAKE